MYGLRSLLLLLALLMTAAPATSQFKTGLRLGWAGLTNKLDSLGSVGGVRMIPPVRGHMPDRFDAVILDTDTYGQGDHIVVLSCPLRDWAKVSRFGVYVWATQTQPIPGDEFGRLQANRCRSERLIKGDKLRARAEVVAPALAREFALALALHPDQVVAQKMRDQLFPTWKGRLVELAEAVETLPALLNLQPPPAVVEEPSPGVGFASLEQALDPESAPCAKQENLLRQCSSRVELLEQRAKLALDFTATVQTRLHNVKPPGHHPEVDKSIEILDAVITALGGLTP